jgi:hypothetical protein
MNRSGSSHVAWSSAGANGSANASNWHTGNRSHPAIAARLLDPAGCKAMGHGVDDTSVDSPATKAAQHYLVTPAFEHIAFPVALGFVAGFVDIFGFMALFGLLPAHVTGNLIFIAVDIARHQYNLIKRIAALRCSVHGGRARDGELTMPIHIGSGMHLCSVEDIKLGFDFIQEASRGRDADTLFPYLSVSLKGSGTKEEEYRAVLMIDLDELLKVMKGLKEVQSKSYASYRFVKVNKLRGEFLKSKRERERVRKASENKQGEGDASMAAHTTTPAMTTRPRPESANNAIICALCGERFATGEALDNHMWCIHREREKSNERAWSSTD